MMQVGPKEAGILEVMAQQKRKPVSSMRITDGHGSSELTGLLEEIQTKKAAAAGGRCGHVFDGGRSGRKVG